MFGPYAANKATELVLNIERILLAFCLIPVIIDVSASNRDMSRESWKDPAPTFVLGLLDGAATAMSSL